MTNKHNISKMGIPVIGSWDVIVVGGGPAGCTAAASAAREGAKTLLIEATGNKTLMRAWNTASPWALGFIRDLERVKEQENVGDTADRDPHEDFMSALERQDIDAAGQSLLAHLSRSWLAPANDDEPLDTATHIVSVLSDLAGD